MKRRYWLVSACASALLAVLAGTAMAQTTGLGGAAPATAPGASTAPAPGRLSLPVVKAQRADLINRYRAARLRAAGIGPKATGRKRIVGGIEAQAGAYPFQVSMLFAATKRGEEAQGHFCGGSLIADTWVMTAAHCVVNPEDNVDFPADTFNIYAGSVNFKNGDRIRVKRIIRHPQYDPTTMDHDIALIELARAPLRRVNAKAVALVSAEERAKLEAAQTNVKVIGWGLTSEGGDLSATLQEVGVNVYENQLCQEKQVVTRAIEAMEMFQQAQFALRFSDTVLEELVAQAASNAGEFVRPGMLCAGELSGGKDSCQGDRGGPLFATDATGKHTQVGVVSWGVGCARPDIPGLYTRISSYQDWIKQVMAPPAPPPAANAPRPPAGSGIQPAARP
jgi:secreted trypsin-like serine protease